ncbi:MAG: helix-turn-helix transcriptional regulator [Segetibacter sp.]|jgi:AraC-like DNA-binding protein|nr:helix-turn-helix transcriptional regulator [Segetibacter sp.]
MVCNRCIMVVKQIVEDAGMQPLNVRLGEVELNNEPSEKELKKLSNDLNAVGFELLDNQKTQLIERIKNLLIQKVQDGDIEEHFSVSKFLTEKIYKDYSSISKLFSEVEGITIEHFFILQKIEKTKEWLVYNELSLAEIAINLGYSSTQHLSNQFKKLTGMTPTQFKKIGTLHRKPLDGVKE